MNLCLICYEPLLTSIKTMKCSHQFHKKCIKKWLDIKPTCPYCLSIVENKFKIHVKFNNNNLKNNYICSIDRNKILLLNCKTDVYKILYIRYIKNISLYPKTLCINYQDHILKIQSNCKQLIKIHELIKEAFTI
uniref:RING-type domain-containing protein n=1 Tax=viral metagenome TaxID=1070528 RepID=A0A6C0IY38_9ZZZZ